MNLYRPSIERIIFLDLFIKQAETWRVQIVTKNKEEFIKHKIMSKYQSKKFKSFKTIVQSADLFNNPGRLSLKTDNFILVEYVEQNPLILGNFGMCSRLDRFIYLTRFALNILKKNGYEIGAKEDLPFLKDAGLVKKEYYKTLKKQFGLKGEEIFLTENEKLPCIGQLT